MKLWHCVFIKQSSPHCYSLTQMVLFWMVCTVSKILNIFLISFVVRDSSAFFPPPAQMRSPPSPLAVGRQLLQSCSEKETNSWLFCGHVIFTITYYLYCKTSFLIKLKFIRNICLSFEVLTEQISPRFYCTVLYCAVLYCKKRTWGWGPYGQSNTSIRGGAKILISSLCLWGHRERESVCKSGIESSMVDQADWHLNIGLQSFRTLGKSVVCSTWPMAFVIAAQAD